jgi:hypothetical protein
MDESEAYEELASMVAFDAEPTLSESEVFALLDRARRADSTGLAFSDSGWTPTWDLNAAAAEGWRRKAGKVAGSFSFSTDGQSFNRSDMVKACLDMARTYSNRVAGSIPLNVTSAAWDTDVAVNTNV